MASESVRVCDYEIETISNNLRKRDKLDNVLRRYIETMKRAAALAVPEGEVHEVLVTLSSNAQSIYDVGVGLGGKTSSLANKFLQEIDSVDLDLYQRGW